MLNAIKNMFRAPLTIKVHDYNMIANDSEFISMLRLLTLRSISGMNHELNSFAEIKKTRVVNAQIITAWRDKEFVAWALLSGEDSNFYFPNTLGGYKPDNNMMFQVFVNPQYRRQGIASELLKTASKIASDKKLAVCPWDDVSSEFYDNHQKTYNAKYL